MKYLIILLSVFNIIISQNVKNSGVINLKNSVNVKIAGTYIHEPNAHIDLDQGTTLSVNGDLINNGGTISGDGQIIVNEEIFYPAPTPPVIGGNNSLIFDGVDDFVELSQDAFSGETVTLMAWFKPKLNLDNAFDSGKPIYCQGASTTTYATFGVGLRPNSIWLEMGPPGNQVELTNSSFDYDQWNHIAISFDNGLVKTYINGSIASTVQAPSNVISNNGYGAFIGRRGNTINVDESYSFQGAISHFSSVPYVLRYDEIIQSMIVSDSLGTNAYNWNFNEGEGSILNDLSSNVNHGTINGAIWTGDFPKLGCTDLYADNYNPDVTFDDGSCSGYLENGDFSLEFDGINDYIKMDSPYLDNLFQGYNSFTISTWLKRSSEQSVSDYLNIFSKGTTPNSEYENPRGVMILTHITGDITFILYSGPYDFIYVSASDFVTTDSWDQITATYDGGSSPESLKLYKNGSLHDNVSYGSNGNYSGIVATDGQPTVLGARLMDNGNTHLPFIGNFNDLSIWSESLTEDQIQNIYANDYEIESTLVGKWDFSEGEGQLLFDRTGNTNHLEIIGPAWSEDVYVPPTPPIIGGNNSLFFDGDDYINFSDDPMISGVHNNFSISFWIRPELSDSWGAVYLKRGHFNDFYFNVLSDERMRFSFKTSNGQPELFGNINYDQWTYVTGTYDGQTARLYIDGELVDQQQVLNGSVDWDYNYCWENFGGNVTTTTNLCSGQYGGFKGYLDDFSIWDQTLTERQIKLNMLSELSGTEPGLVGHWDFNEGEGSILNDLSSNVNHGTINGAIWTGDFPKPGCTDPYADNYDSEATTYDGNCSYLENDQFSLFFDGIDDGVSGIASQQLDVSDNHTLTISALIKPESGLEEPSIIFAHTNNDRWHQYALILNPDGKLYFISGYASFEEGGNNVSNNSVIFDEWNQVSMTYDGSAVRFYINGQMDFVHNVEDTFGTQFMGDFHIGHVDGSSRYKGLIGHVSIWDLALNQESINDLSELNGDENGLVGFWGFMAGENNLLYDRSGNQSHGIIDGAIWSNDFPYYGPEWFVSTNGDDSNEGSQESPFATIQHAINASSDGHIVLVAPGTYYENINYNGKNIIVMSELGVDSTIIDGGENGSVVTFNNSETNGPALDGFTITNGLAYPKGGGIYISGASPELNNLIIKNNISNPTGQGGSGGGVMIEYSNLTVLNNVIIVNNLGIQGGGVFIDHNSNVELSNCTIAGNNAESGGAITSYISNLTMSNCIVWGNNTENNQHLNLNGNSVVSYSNIEGLSNDFSGNGNIDSDPLFCNISSGDYGLSQDSPCIGRGEFGSDIGAMFGLEDGYCELSIVNKSLSFNGDDDRVEVSYEALSGLDNITFSCWFKNRDTDSHYQTIIQQPQGMYIRYEHNLSNFYFVLFAGGDGSNQIIIDAPNQNEWKHIAVTYDGSNIIAYLNGVIVGNIEATGSIFNENPIYIGNYLTQEGFSGNLDEIRIWSVALTQDQINSNMNSELVGDEENLAAYWNFNEGQGSTLFDLSGNGYDGTIYGAQWHSYGAPLEPQEPIYGCNDPYAENFDSNANVNDSSCEYSQNSVTFTKVNYADPELEENQDRITANVWLTRGECQPLYNAALEGSSDRDISPMGTLWKMGPSALHRTVDDYLPLRQAVYENMEEISGKVMSLYVEDEGLFYDIEFHSWTSNCDGGGFSYTRTPAEINSFEYPENAVYFEKSDYANHLLEENQDRITDRTWISRDNSQGIFNAVSESSYNFDYEDDVHSAPSNTLWAFGLTSNAQIENYKPFKQAVQDSISMRDIAGYTLSMFVVPENKYYDVEFHSWTSNGDGGGFSYTRTDQYGDSFTFTKDDYADYTLEQNQDRVSENVWITRQEEEPIFNFAIESSYSNSPRIFINAVGSPENTEWSYGRTSELVSSNYQPWQAALGGSNPRNAVGQFMSMHLIEEDLYFDVVFHSWTCCGDGGGFSYTRIPAQIDSEPNLNGKLLGFIKKQIDDSALEGARVIAVTEDGSYSAETYTDINGDYNIDLIGGLNYFVNISYDGLVDHNEYIYVAAFEDTYLNASLSTLENAIVEGIVMDWYTNAPLVGASVLLAYSDNEMITVESITDESGYFLAEVPGEKNYDLFAYSDGYWVEHDAFYLSSGEHQVLNIGIAEMSAASRLYGAVRDFDTDELIPYAEIQLNCDQASDWDHTGELGTYRVFNYYPGDCDDGVLVVTANGYETSVQSVGNIEFEAGSSYDLDIALVQGNDPDPGMLSGMVYSNIDGNVVEGAEVVAYNVNTTQLFSIETSDDGYYQLFLPESEYYISINAPYHEELLDTLSITSGQSFTMDFYLDQVIEYKISGVVSDQNGNPLSGFETFVTRGNGYRTTYTNENGEYELFVPNGTYDVGSGSNNYFINLVSGVEVQDNDIVLDFVLESIQEFDGGFAGTVHLNDGDITSVQINVWDNNSTYNAYVSSDENGTFALPLVNGTYNIYAWVPSSDYESIYIPNAFTVEDNVISYDLYFIAPDGPEAPTIVFLEDVPNDQGGQLELAWTPGEPREYEIFPQYSVWRMGDEWNLIATVPYHGFDLYNMIVPTLGDSTSDGIFESRFMVTAHTLDQNTFFDSDPLTGYSIDNIFPAIPQQLIVSIEGEAVELDWNVSADEDFSYYNVYRQDQSLLEAATIFETENNYYSDNIEIDGDYQYWVTAVDNSGNESDPSEPAMVTLGVQEDLMPIEFALMQNYPNPFNPSTQIMYSLPKTSSVKIVIYNMLGSKVRTLYSGLQDAGYKNVLWNATNDQGDPVSAGMYIYTIEAENFFASKKMILLK